MITATWIVDDVVTMPQPEQMLAIESSLLKLSRSFVFAAPVSPSTSQMTSTLWAVGRFTFQFAAAPKQPRLSVYRVASSNCLTLLQLQVQGVQARIQTKP